VAALTPRPRPRLTLTPAHTRVVFGVALAGAWLGETVNTYEVPGAAAIVAPAIWSALSLAFLAAGAAFLYGVRPRLSGAALLLLLVVAAAVEAKVVGRAGEHHGKHLPALALAAMVACAALGRERLAHQAACGAVGAAYVLSGLAKLLGSGAAWWQGGTLGLLVAERAVAGPAWLAAPRLQVALSPHLCSVLALATLLIECAGVAMLWPRARRAWAVAALGLHAGVALLMGYVYVTWVMVVVALAFGSFVMSPHDAENTQAAPPARG